VSSLPQTNPTILAPTTPDRVPPRPEESTRSRNDDDRFADRLDRETSRPERSDTRRSDTTASRSESSPSQSDRAERSDRAENTSQSDRSDAVSDAAPSEVAKDQTTDDDTSDATGLTEPTSSDAEQPADRMALNLEAALALLAEMQSTETAELTITARSGETISLTPPTATHNGQVEPGSLGRWFVEAAGPAGPGLATSGRAGADAQMADLLSKIGPATNQAGNGLADPGNLSGQGLQNGQAPQGPALDSTGLASGQNTSFADALASSASTETMDSFMSQAAAKIAGAAEAATTGPSVVTPAPTAATATQPAMTAVPQSTAGQAVPVTALAVEINRQAMNGKTQFDIRLDPPELGRLNVKLEVDGNGQTRTHLVVERGETLDMLTTDSRSLERALQQAGLKAEPGSVTFELAQDFNEGLAQNGSQTENSETGDNGSGASEGAPTGDEGLIPELTDMSSIEAVRQQLYLTGHLDVRV
jgi:flagellar hook-length control protein FliK